ncbi:hypothetical protein Taro_036055 [Colocasia esculenta]|uniref:X8 domain-containing protein n=1 Tax=Colocasia esculenta TaxID=4460 RepID=A0A843W226_COLES|nr:hypothetical protein [Colocasia esculenta]
MAFMGFPVEGYFYIKETVNLQREKLMGTNLSIPRGQYPSSLFITPSAFQDLKIPGEICKPDESGETVCFPQNSLQAYRLGFDGLSVTHPQPRIEREREREGEREKKKKATLNNHEESVGLRLQPAVDGMLSGKPQLGEYIIILSALLQHVSQWLLLSPCAVSAARIPPASATTGGGGGGGGRYRRAAAESTVPIPTLSPREGNTTFLGGTTWCVARPGALLTDVQRALDWACGPGDGAADCSPVQVGGACYEPDTLLGHASYAFNSYYQQNGNSDVACNFGGTAALTTRDPSE